MTSLDVSQLPVQNGAVILEFGIVKAHRQNDFGSGAAGCKASATLLRREQQNEKSAGQTGTLLVQPGFKLQSK